MELKLRGKVLSCLMAVVLALGLCPGFALANDGGSSGGTTLAAGAIGDLHTQATIEKFAYDGDGANFIKEDGSGFGMFTPQDGTTIAIVGDNVVISYVPKNTTVYAGFYLGGDISVPAEWDENAFYALEDGRFSISLPADEYCGYAWPVAAVKPDMSTTSTQYYLAIPAKDKIPVAVVLEDGTYKLPDLAAGPSAMFNHLIETESFLKVEGDSATIIFTEDGSTASVGKYSRLALGKSSELLPAEGNYFADTVLPEGTVIIEGTDAGMGTSGTKWHFEVPITKAEAEALLGDPNGKFYVTVWNNVGSNAEKIPGWYKPSDDIYLSLGELGDKIVEPVELTIENKTTMFKAVTASAVANSDGSATLTFALSGTGYHYLYKGTYEQAVANGDAIENWAAGYLNADGKWEFQIPIAADELGTDVPVVAISQSYYEKYLSGQNSLERAFYPRQFNLDLEKATLTTGDFEATKHIAVTNNVKMFKPCDNATLECVGGPNSNNYKADLVLPMQNETMTNVYVGTYDEAVAATESIAFDTSTATDAQAGTFTIPVKWVETFGDPTTAVNLANGEPFYMTFKSSKGWYERIATLDENAGTLVFDPSDADYTAVEAAQDAAAALSEADYTASSWAALQEALAAVETGKFESQQAEVDAMAAAINSAIKALAKPQHTLTIKYNYGANGKQAANPYVKKYDEGAAYNVPIPAVTGYDAKVNDIKASSVKGTMGKSDVTVQVFYWPAVPDGKGKSSTHRLAGDTALDTMAAIVNAGGFPTGGTVVLTTSTGYWDALTAAGIAGKANAPVIMTDGKSLSAQTKSLIQKLKPTKIIICGGTAAVTKGVENQATAAAGGKPNVVRCAGDTATGTACKIFDEGKKLGAWSNTAFVCTNDGYWDALAAAPISYASGMPIFLTEGKSAISTETLNTMKKGGVSSVYIVGGPVAISDNVRSQIEANGIRVVGRFSGADSIETSQLVAQFGIEKMHMTPNYMGVATTDGYWDALAGAALCGSKGSVLVLANGPQATSVTSFMKKYSGSIADFYVFGGTAAVSKATENAAETAAK